MITDKLTSAAPALEREILGSVLICAGAGDDLLADLELGPEDFSDSRHAALWALMQERHAQKQAIDLVSLGDAWDATGDMRAACDAFGGMFYVLNHDKESIPACAQQHAARLREYTRRRVARRALAQAAEAMGSDDSADEIMTKALGALHTAAASVDPYGSVSDYAAQVWDRIEDEAEGRRDAFVLTGIPEWDRHSDFQGLSADGVTLVLAASGMGKTSLINRLTLGLTGAGRSVYLHGTETSGRRRLRDLAYSLGAVDARAWGTTVRAANQGSERARDSVESDRNRLGHALDDLIARKLEITGGGLSVDDLCRRARSLHRRGQCDVLLVDYLQDLVWVRGGVDLNKGPQTTYASARLKELASELDIPIVVAAQVSGEKDGVGVQDPRPQMWDAQWSSGAHQDAEEVYALYREDYYRDRFGDGWKPRGGRSGHIEVIARKRRVGRLGTLELKFDGPTKWVGRRPDGGVR